MGIGSGADMANIVVMSRDLSNLSYRHCKYVVLLFLAAWLKPLNHGGWRKRSWTVADRQAA